MRRVRIVLASAFAALAVVGMLGSLLGACGTGTGGSSRSPPDPTYPQVQHIVVVMMENRSFDHFLGWHPTADARQEGLTYPDRNGAAQPTYPLAPDFQGCGHPDPDHSHAGGRVQVNGGAMDGFLQAGDSDIFAAGFYREEDRPFMSALARNFTTCDRSFASILGPTFPNRLFLHAAQTDRLRNRLDRTDLRTIWDRLDDAGVKGRYYFSDASFLLLWGEKYRSIMRPYSDFLEDARKGHLPAVAFVEPRFLNDETGTSGSDHPHGDIREGDAWLAETFEAVVTGPDWESTVFILTYDEWGGFFDHVAPPRAAAPNGEDPDIVGGKALLGLRVPTIVASPFSRGDPANPRVVSVVFDHTSILKMIEEQWRLDPLTARDASTDVGSLFQALDLDAFDASDPGLPVPPFPDVDPCPDPDNEDKWKILIPPFSF